MQRMSSQAPAQCVCVCAIYAQMSYEGEMPAITNNPYDVSTHAHNTYNLGLCACMECRHKRYKVQEPFQPWPGLATTLVNGVWIMMRTKTEL